MSKVVSILPIVFLAIKNMKAQNYQEDWDFYMLNVDDKIASIYLDLGLVKIAPIEGKGDIFWISIKMNNPKDNGLTSNEESEKLWTIEDFIVEQINSRHDVIYVGRLTNKSHRDLYFYFGEDILIDKTLSECMVRFPEYEYDYGVKENDEWESYFSFLYPSPRSYQSIMNRRVLDYMKEQGDKLEKTRQVDHWIYFKTENDRNNYSIKVQSLGFKVTGENIVDDEKGFKFQLVISREDQIGWNEIDKYTIELWELAKELNGDYCGWEAPLLIENKE